MSVSKEWLEAASDESREGDEHRHPGEEMLFYRAVADGRLKDVQDNIKTNAFADMSGRGVLSDNPLTNLKYHFVVTAALVTRFCAEAGMPTEMAFGLSDFYIQKMDHAASAVDVIMLHDQMLLDYTGRMAALRRNVKSSRQVSDAVDYIYAHLLDRVTVEEIAWAINISPTYLSRVFKQEMGIAVSEYIRREKIDVAKNLLRYTDYTLTDIANKLSFSSQSHFNQQFRAQVGMTPKAYRDKYYMNTFLKDEEETPGDE